MAAPRPPRRIGRYEIRKELGRGTMGVVYEALDPSLDRDVALKVIHVALAVSPRERKVFEKRFLAEARIAARLSHPGIVVVHDVGRDEKSGTLYIALERLQGQTLADRLGEKERLDWKEALRIVERVARALHYAHAQGVVHRDIKPANIMLLPSGEPKIMDFGLAKHLGHELTQSGQYVGTPLFMSPEQVLGEPVDGRTDLFSLGSVLYTLLTGKRAFAADSVPRIMARVAYQHPPAPSALVRGLPPELDYLVARSMAKSPADRHPSGAALAEDAEDVRGERAPRHRSGWTAPVVGQGTVASPRGDAAAFLDLGLEPVGKATAAGRRKARTSRGRARASPLRALPFGLFLAGLAALYFSAAYPERFDALVRAPLLLSLLESLPPAGGRLPAPSSPLPVAATPSAPADPAAARVPRPPEPSPGSSGAEPDPMLAEEDSDAPLNGERAGAPDPGEPQQEAGPPLEDEPEARPRPQLPELSPPPATPPAPARPTPPPHPPPKPAPPRRTPPPVKTEGRLAVSMEHHLKSGTVQLFVDGKLVLEETLDSKVTKKILFFSIRKGVLEETLKVPPGRHQISVRVRWDDNDQTRRISGTFKGGQTRRLRIGISRLGGDLSLEWR